MKINFCLAWLAAGSKPSKAFKSPGAESLMTDYVTRIRRFAPCEIAGWRLDKSKTAGMQVWACDRKSTARMLSSEQLAARIEKLSSSGVRELHIVIGDANGFSDHTFLNCVADFYWSFGPMTLPHELAAVVASEQIYRAYSIMHALPYHLGH